MKLRNIIVSLILFLFIPIVLLGGVHFDFHNSLEKVEYMIVKKYLAVEPVRDFTRINHQIVGVLDEFFSMLNSYALDDQSWFEYLIQEGYISYVLINNNGRVIRIGKPIKPIKEKKLTEIIYRKGFYIDKNGRLHYGTFVHGKSGEKEITIDVVISKSWFISQLDPLPGQWDAWYLYDTNSNGVFSLLTSTSKIPLFSRGNKKEFTLHFLDRKQLAFIGRVPVTPKSFESIAVCSGYIDYHIAILIGLLTSFVLTILLIKSFFQYLVSLKTLERSGIPMEGEEKKGEELISEIESEVRQKVSREHVSKKPDKLSVEQDALSEKLSKETGGKKEKEPAPLEKDGIFIKR